jgi:hypothetical protein
MALMNRLKKESAIWESEALDTFTFHTSMEYLKKHQPRVMYLSLGERLMSGHMPVSMPTIFERRSW